PRFKAAQWFAVPLNKTSLPAWALVALVLSSWTRASAVTNTYSGVLSNGFYSFNRPATTTTLSGKSVYFHPIYFTVQGSTPGNVTATVSAVGFTPRVQFYQNAIFDPFDPLYNLYWTG